MTVTTATGGVSVTRDDTMKKWFLSPLRKPRLLESVHISDECKAEFHCGASLLNPIQLKQQMDKARERFFKLSVIEVSIPSVKVS